MHYKPCEGKMEAMGSPKRRKYVSEYNSPNRNYANKNDSKIYTGSGNNESEITKFKCNEKFNQLQSHSPLPPRKPLQSRSPDFSVEFRNKYRKSQSPDIPLGNAIFDFSNLKSMPKDEIRQKASDFMAEGLLISSRSMELSTSLVRKVCGMESGKITGNKYVASNKEQCKLNIVPRKVISQTKSRGNYTLRDNKSKL